jgi:uncharacterized protein YjbJ (UPF0337 family)
MNWLVELRKIGVDLIAQAPMSLQPWSYLPGAVATTTRQAERRAGYCEGVRMTSPKPERRTTEHHDAASQSDEVLRVTGQRAPGVDLPPRSKPCMDEEVNERWKQQIGSAQQAWTRLTESELLASNGMAEKLTALIQDRYSLSADDAARRVKRFFDKLQS